MRNDELNENDNKLLAFCMNRRRSISEIARELNISVKNVSVRIAKLKSMNKVIVEETGYKKYIRTVGGDKTMTYFAKILKTIELNGGDMKWEDYMALIPFESDDARDVDKFNAPLKLLWSSPKLVEQHIRLTPAGKRFLEEQLEKNDKQD